MQICSPRLSAHDMNAKVCNSAYPVISDRIELFTYRPSDGSIKICVLD